LHAGVSNTITIGSSTFTTSVSGNNGGVIYMAGPENTLSTDASTSFTSSTAAQSGGLLYIAGTTGD